MEEDEADQSAIVARGLFVAGPTEAAIDIYVAARKVDGGYIRAVSVRSVMEPYQQLDGDCRRRAAGPRGVAKELAAAVWSAVDLGARMAGKVMNKDWPAGSVEFRFSTEAAAAVMRQLAGIDEVEPGYGETVSVGALFDLRRIGRQWTGAMVPAKDNPAEKMIDAKV